MLVKSRNVWTIKIKIVQNMQSFWLERWELTAMMTSSFVQDFKSNYCPYLQIWSRIHKILYKVQAIIIVIALVTNIIAIVINIAIVICIAIVIVISITIIMATLQSENLRQSPSPIWLESPLAQKQLLFLREITLHDDFTYSFCL